MFFHPQNSWFFVSTQFANTIYFRCDSTNKPLQVRECGKSVQQQLIVLRVEDANVLVAFFIVFSF